MLYFHFFTLIFTRVYVYCRLSLTFKQRVITWACYYGHRKWKWQTAASSPIIWWSARTPAGIPENHHWDEPWSLSTNQPSWLGGTNSALQAPTLEKQHIKGIPAAYRDTATCSITRQLVPSPWGEGSFSIEATKACLLNTTCGEGTGV